VSTTNATKARQNLFRLIDQVNDSHEPVLITGKKGSAVLISEGDWKAIEETLYLSGIPGMVESIRDGMNTPTADMDDTLEW
jgi:antitoxin YefM